MKTIIFILFLFLTMCVYSQNNEKNTRWMEYLEELSENEIESSQIEQFYEELSYLSEHPFDINTATKQELERLPFLTKIQIENIQYYIYKYGPLNTIYELKNIDGLDFETIQLILPFIKIIQKNNIEKLNLRNVINYGKNEFLLRTDYCFQEKAGYRKASDEEKEQYPNRFYLGEPYYLSFRYGFQYKERIQFSLVGEKDPGEAFWNKHHKGFDFYSGNLSLKNFGVIEGLYLGDYRVSFGQGLIINTDFSIGKTSDINSISKKNSGIKRHYSSNENDYFRGVGSTLKFNNTKLHLFISSRNLDAIVYDSFIRSFKTDGYHRTVKDIEKHNQARLNVGGISVIWGNSSFKVGGSIIGYNFGGKKLDPDPKPYNIYSLRDKNNYNMSFDYSYQRKKFIFHGETATDKNGALATINNLLFTPSSFFSYSLSYRNYSKKYQAYFSRSLSESSSIQNESGLFLGTKYSLRHWLFTAYADVFSFPWLKFGIDSPSFGKDILLQSIYFPNANWNMVLRYKFKSKYKNITNKTVEVLPTKQHKWKYQLSYKSNSGISLKTQLNYNKYFNGIETSGWSISQALGWKTLNSKLYMDLSFAYFKVFDWNNRIYSSEKNILYVFNMPSYYGEGIRYYTTLKWSVCNALSLYAKISTSHYFDKNTISSELEEISGKEKTEFNLLLNLKF